MICVGGDLVCVLGPGEWVSAVVPPADAMERRLVHRGRVKLGAQVLCGSRANLVLKVALITLIESLDDEYGGEGRRANVLLPGTIDTPANRSAMSDAKNGSWVRPEHFADAVSVLQSAAFGFKSSEALIALAMLSLGGYRPALPGRTAHE